MGMVQDYVRKIKDRKNDDNSYAQEQNTIDSYHQKKISSNERELMRYQEEERQKRIKLMLASKRKEENDKIWRGQENNPVYTKNIIANHKKLFGSGNMFSKMHNVASQPNVVNQPNVIKSHNLFKRKDRFFKGGK